MTKIPPEYPAARSLEQSFRTMGAGRARAPRPSRPLASTRVVVVALTSVLAVAGVATGTKAFLGDGGTVNSDETGLKGVRGGVEPAPAYRQLAQATAGDPTERPPWGLRLFKSAKGLTCLTLGRVVGGRLGVIRQGQFKELPSRASGMCAPLERQHLLMAARISYPTSASTASRTIVYGAVDRTVRRVRVLFADGRRRAVPIAADGTFLVVAPSASSFKLARLVADGSAGRQIRPIGA